VLERVGINPIPHDLNEVVNARHIRESTGNPILRGWVNYFAIGYSTRWFHFVKRLEIKVRRHLMRARKCRRSARNSNVAFDAARAGNVTMAAGLRATAKVVEQPPEPKVGAPVLDPTQTDMVMENQLNPEAAA
jgi:hypothetical protein